MPQVDYKRELDILIESVIEQGASDLHLSVGSHPMLRLTGVLVPLVKKPILANEDVELFLDVMVNDVQMQDFIVRKEIDFSYAHASGTRFRVNAFYQKGNISIVMRAIPSEIRSLSELNLPAILENFAMRPQGFFLCVGPVGQGKSTTLAAMIEHINVQKAGHIVTIEDPIEYIYTPQKSLIDQREVRVDTRDFATALNSAFRQDVNVILVGEMRNAETISTAVTAAETGHLVLSTLHTNNAAQTVDRIIDSFPAHQQDQIRIQLASSLAGIFSQRLVPRISGGFIPTYELLINNSAVSNLIREARTHEIATVIETGLEHGMIDMNRSLVDLVKKGEVTAENAFAHAVNPKGLERLL